MPLPDSSALPNLICLNLSTQIVVGRMVCYNIYMVASVQSLARFKPARAQKRKRDFASRHRRRPGQSLPPRRPHRGKESPTHEKACVVDWENGIRTARGMHAKVRIAAQSRKEGGICALTARALQCPRWYVMRSILTAVHRLCLGISLALDRPIFDSLS